MSNTNGSLHWFTRRRPAANDNRIFTRSNAYASASLCPRPAAGSMVAQVLTTLAHDSDPYLLVLLADQEIAANRPEQAQSLIEAAYAAYDHDRSGF